MVRRSRPGRGETGGIVRGAIRLLVLAVAAATVLGIGMSRYGWKPFGRQWTWERITGRASAEAKQATRPVTRALDGATRDATGAAKDARRDAVGALEKVERKIEGEAKHAGAAVRDAVQDARDKVAAEGKKDSDGLTKDDKDARDELLKKKGL